MWCFLFFAFILGLSQQVYGSIGDAQPFFQECMKLCKEKFGCPQGKFEYGWTTKECFECRYDCMWSMVEVFEKNNWKTPQFFGKWPFLAISWSFGPFYLLIQEPASTLFSLLNLFSVVYLHCHIKSTVPDAYRIKNVFLYYAYIGSLVWICSTIFHSRDFWFTELLDYFSACGIIVYAMFASISFAFPWLQGNKTGRKVWKMVSSGFVMFYFQHIYGLWIRFDYAYNMMCCIFCSLATSILYLIWVVLECYQGRKRKSLAYLVATIAIGLGSVLFEVFDFPPILWTFDAHSLFHLATVPAPILLAKFIELEADYEMKKKKKILLNKNV